MNPIPQTIPRWWPGPDAASGEAALPGRLLTGTLQATAVTVWIDPGIIQGWLPRGVRFPEPRPDPHPLSIVWGWQHDVTAFPGGGRYAVPWRLSYAEIITAVPDLQLDPQAGMGYDGPVTYLPRLYMNSWRAALLGRALYGFSKAFARVEASDSRYRAADRRGAQLMSAKVAGETSTGARSGPLCDLFEQPVVLGSAGRLMVARFETTLSRSPVQPVSVEMELHPALLSYVPAIRRFARGVDREPGGAFQFSTAWTLRRIPGDQGRGLGGRQ